MGFYSGFDWLTACVEVGSPPRLRLGAEEVILYITTFHENSSVLWYLVFLLKQNEHKFTHQPIQMDASMGRQNSQILVSCDGMWHKNANLQ